MKAVFGKISILFSISCLILWAIGIARAFAWMILIRDVAQECANLELDIVVARLSEAINITMFAVLCGGLLILLGFLFCYLSARKQEVPRLYRYIGFSLNLAPCIFLSLSLLVILLLQVR